MDSVIDAPLVRDFVFVELSVGALELSSSTRECAAFTASGLGEENFEAIIADSFAGWAVLVSRRVA